MGQRCCAADDDASLPRRREHEHFRNKEISSILKSIHFESPSARRRPSPSLCFFEATTAEHINMTVGTQPDLSVVDPSCITNLSLQSSICFENIAFPTNLTPLTTECDYEVLKDRYNYSCNSDSDTVHGTKFNALDSSMRSLMEEHSDLESRDDDMVSDQAPSVIDCGSPPHDQHAADRKGRHQHSEQEHFDEAQISQIQMNVARRVKYRASAVMHSIDEMMDPNPPLMVSPKHHVLPIIPNRFGDEVLSPKLEPIESEFQDTIELLRVKTNIELSWNQDDSSPSPKSGFLKAISPKIEFLKALSPKSTKVSLTWKSPKSPESPRRPMSPLDVLQSISTQIIPNREKRVNRRMSRTPDPTSLSTMRTLPAMSGWIELKRRRKWRKKWVMVSEDALTWSDKQSARSPMKRKKRNSLDGQTMVISKLKCIEPVMTGKSERKFRVVAPPLEDGGQSREYLWKCGNVQDRNQWVRALKEVHSTNQSKNRY